MSLEYIKTVNVSLSTKAVYVYCDDVEYRLYFRDGLPFGAMKRLSEDAYRGTPRVNTRHVKGPKKAWEFAARFIVNEGMKDDQC